MSIYDTWFGVALSTQSQLCMRLAKVATMRLEEYEVSDAALS